MSPYRYPLLPGERPTGDYKPSTISDPNCQACGLPEEGHIRCAECRVFVGPGHAVQCLEDGQHCGTCARWLAKGAA